MIVHAKCHAALFVVLAAKIGERKVKLLAAAVFVAKHVRAVSTARIWNLKVIR